MSPKKKKRPQAAQALIDELLDEKNSAKKGDVRSDQSSQGSFESEPFLLELDEAHEHGTTVPKENDYNSMGGLVVEDGSSMDLDLSLEISKPIEMDPIAKANKTAIEAERTRLQTSVAPKPESKRSTPAPFDGTSPLVTQVVKKEDRSDDPDFSLMSSEEQEDDRTMQIDSVSEISAPKPSPLDVDATVRASRDIRQSKPKSLEESKPLDRAGATEIRSGLKLASSGGGSSNVISAASAVFASSEAALKQSESLRIAQSRISEMEQELERLRRENEDLAAAGETLRRRADELISKAEQLEIKEREAQRIADEERKVLRGQLQAKDRENAELRARVEEIELRLESNFKKIRVRERELEHRLEIVKLESSTLVSTKDKMILELKRQLDQLAHENDLAKAKSQEMYNQNKDKQETIRRVVRALRIALTILEGDDETVVPLKKAE